MKSFLLTAFAALVSAAPSCTARKSYDEFVTNGGFETSNTTLAPWTPYTPAQVLVHPGIVGANAVRLYQSYPTITQTVPLCFGLYKIQFWYNHHKVSTTGASSLRYRIRSTNTAYETNINLTAGTGDQSYSFTDVAYIPSDGNYTIEVASGVQANEWVVVDGFSLQFQYFSYKPGSTSPLGNPGFETGSLAPWYGNATIVNYGITGNYSVIPLGFLYQNLTNLIPGQLYTISFNYSIRFFDPTCEKPYITVLFKGFVRDPNVSPFQTVYGDQQPPSSGITYSAPFVAQKGWTSLVILGGTSSTGAANCPDPAFNPPPRYRVDDFLIQTATYTNVAPS